jgi:hypothetical protein
MLAIVGLKIMITENSGKIYRFKLDHDLGFGFAEVYDFTDHSMFDGRLVYVYNKVDIKCEKEYGISEIRKSKIALGPIRLYKFPASRGLHSWKFLFKADELLITELPETKELHSLDFKNNDWSKINTWYKSKRDFKDSITYVDYEEIRHLETRIINSPSGVAKEFTMRVILDRNENVSDYYDLSDLGSKNLFTYLINTYYPLTSTKKYLNQIPKV